MDLSESRPSAVRTLTTPAVNLTDSQAERIAREYFGIDATASRLAGETDCNFVLRAPDARYFLKVAHPSEDPQIVDLHTKLLEALQGVPDVPVQRVVRSLRGDANPEVAVPGTPVRRARMTSFIEGRPLAAIGTDPALRGLVGRTGARIAEELRDFSHPAAEWPIVWDMWHADSTRPLLADLQHLPGHGLLTETLDRFDSTVRPVLAGLRRQMVHNDLNGDNVLVTEDGRSVAGVIDFGDAVVTQLVNDVASAMCNHLADDDDPVAPAVDVMLGYHELTPLERAEIGLLYDLVRLRIVLRIIITEWRAVRFPANREYILRSTPRAWRVMARMPIAAEPENTRRLMEASGHT